MIASRPHNRSNPEELDQEWDGWLGTAETSSSKVQARLMPTSIPGTSLGSEQIEPILKLFVSEACDRRKSHTCEIQRLVEIALVN
jgi:hypothetical protein